MVFSNYYFGCEIELVEPIKNSQSIEQIIKYFKPQHVRDRCWETSSSNIMRELGYRHSYPSLKNMTLNKVGKLFRSAWGTGPTLLIHNLSRIMRNEKWDYQCKEIFAPESNIERLKSIIEDDSKSYPMISFGPKYLVEIRKCGNNLRKLDHVGIVLKIKDNEVSIFDPFQFASHSSQDLMDCMQLLNTTIFIKYWVEANIQSQWIMWIEQKEKIDIERALVKILPKKTKLEDFNARG